jgi:solute carrier family 25 citrate transporter 1
VPRDATPGHPLHPRTPLERHQPWNTHINAERRKTRQAPARIVRGAARAQRSKRVTTTDALLLKKANGVTGVLMSSEWTTQLVAGGTAGLADALLLHPADMCKVRAQTGPRENVVRAVYAEGGVRAFYRGLGPVVSTIVPKVAVRFTAFHQLQALVGRSSFAGNLAAGMGAGAVEALLVVTPSEVIKIRQQERGNRSRSQLAVLRTVLSENGVRGLYRGLGATMLRQSGQQGSKFAVFYAMRDAIPSDLLAGLVANSAGAVLNTPLDVVKTRIQRQTAGTAKYRTLLQSFVLIWREEGLSAFGRGLVPRLVRIGPAGAIQFAVFERVKRMMQ